MFYHFLYPLQDQWTAFNVFQYITFRTAYAAVTALLISFIFGNFVITKLQSLQIGETFSGDGPESHKAKVGTPTMGGVLIIAAIVIPTLLWANLGNRFIQLALLSTVWMGTIGFVDDYLKVVRKKPKGMIGRFKLAGQVGFSALLWIILVHVDGGELSTSTAVPFFKNIILDWGWFYLPLLILVVTGTSNAVNLTDGLDGLAIGLSAFAFAGFALLSYLTGNIIYSGYLNIVYLPGAGELTVFCGAVVGAALGFLWFNAHPAKIFMGDTGSLALGGALGTIAILVKKEMLLAVIGGMFVIEALSVMIQVGSFRMRSGKRVFRMAPIHHHFEALGWSETQIVVRFWIIGILLLLVGLSTIKLQ
ncbi:phospho-N-acetylmuramoyl-pentapeptide-transferase [bacterium]|nr:phospho-N-acetylmuramoyl-pentapeptide-transferase [bacterium]